MPFNLDRDVDDFFRPFTPAGLPLPNVGPGSLFAKPEPEVLPEVVVTGKIPKTKVVTPIAESVGVLSRITRVLNPLVMLFTPGVTGPRGTGELTPDMRVWNPPEAPQEPELLDEVLVQPPAKPPSRNNPVANDPFNTPNWDDLADPAGFVDPFGKEWLLNAAKKIQDAWNIYRRLADFLDFGSDPATRQPVMQARPIGDPELVARASPQQKPIRGRASVARPGADPLDLLSDAFLTQRLGPLRSPVFKQAPSVQPVPRTKPAPRTDPIGDPFSPLAPLNPPQLSPPKLQPIGDPVLNPLFDPHEPTIDLEPFRPGAPAPDPFEQPFAPKEKDPNDTCNCDKEPKKKKKKKKSEPRSICYKGTYRQLRKGISYRRGEQVPCDDKAPRAPARSKTAKARDRKRTKKPKDIGDLVDIIFGT